MLHEYRRKEVARVTAVQLDLDTEGFSYRKWGGMQRCKRGDWLVNRQADVHTRGDVYTVDAEIFQRTYRVLSPGVYEKVAPVWAEQTESRGTIQTKEGSTDYNAGDYLVFNDPARKDGYAMDEKTFLSLYEPGKAIPSGQNGD